MTGQLTTLDDLKSSIHAVEQAWNGDAVSDYVAAALRAEAWRAAFGWNVGWHERFDRLSAVVGSGVADWAELELERREGMALIAEKLR